MTDIRLSTRRELELMQHLQQLANDRASQERILAAALEAQLTAAHQQFEDTARQLNDHHAQRRIALEQEYAAAVEAAKSGLEQGQRDAEQAYRVGRKEIEKVRAEAAAAAEHNAEESQWQALAVFDASKNQPQLALEEALKRIQARRRQIDGLERDAQTLVAMRRLTQRAEQYGDGPSIGPAAEALAEPVARDVSSPPSASDEDRLQAALADLRQSVLDMQDQKVASLFLEGGRWLGWVGVITTMFTVTGGFLDNLQPMGWIVGALLGLAVGLGVVFYFLPRGRRSTLAANAAIQRKILAARQLDAAAVAEAKSVSQRRAEEIVRRRDRDVSEAHAKRDLILAELEARQAADTQLVESERTSRLESLKSERERALTEADAKFPPLLTQNEGERRQADRDNSERFDAARAQANSEHEAAWQAMADGWLTGFREVAAELAAMHARCRELFPDWSDDSWREFQRPATPPEAIRFGECPLPLQLVKNAAPEDKRLDPGVRRLVLPATMTLAEQPRLMITADGAGRRAAVDVLQLVMLRFLASMPAGKLRLTIIDPSGLGENFSAFMHLADYDEQLVAGRIWTDSKHIDERLSLISEHMEKVLQKYLRNEFATLHEYNLSAGEVAEPYQLVVVANFPNGFSDAAARKLISIASSGPRCGVYSLVSVDRGVRLPHEFRLNELLDGAVHLDWVDNRLLWRYPLFEKLPLELDHVPEGDRLSEVLRVAGQQSREASRVEVPFAVVAPEPGKLWAEDGGRELVVPIGRAGAKELQSLRFGIGTSQHGLIAGKTGSGKSTLLHALITNLALHYSPDQVEFYLVDFKKGVEFKAYATGRLPHARVIAIESEREFGVSVLERLDQELRRRGELFRNAGVQDLAGFRRAMPDVPMPRTLLIIDEFQELFVADDKLAADAALLMDRLVRQGRAFGIHVLLGSQTLAGAYSLARSTLGQMAVRIALECSEADAHLILSDENTAARLLTRPGEAIYNDQNGLLVGNHPFQVVWLPDAERQKYLATLRGLPLSDRQTHEPAIVFEGNVPANPQDNPDLVATIAGAGGAPAEPTLWLGSAVRIEPATRLVLRRQGGHHLAIIGGQEALAVGMLGNAAIALAAQQGEAPTRIIVLDGTRPESQAQGVWSQVADAVGDVLEIIPPRGAAAAVNALAEEVARRAAAPDERYGSIYLIVHDLAQFRDLRQTEDDFSFSSNGKPPSVDKRFREILKEGPIVGVHVLLWCESYNSLTRAVDRLSLREIEFRVAMQMSAADSTSLIDSPAAALLGEHRSLLYRDDLGTQTKFRPYGRPSPDWLAWVAGHLRRGLPTEPASAAGGPARS